MTMETRRARAKRRRRQRSRRRSRRITKATTMSSLELSPEMLGEERILAVMTAIVKRMLQQKC